MHQMWSNQDECLGARRVRWACFAYVGLVGICAVQTDNATFHTLHAVGSSIIVTYIALYHYKWAHGAVHYEKYRDTETVRRKNMYKSIEKQLFLKNQYACDSNHTLLVKFLFFFFLLFFSVAKQHHVPPPLPRTHLLPSPSVSICLCGVTFTWWACYGVCPRHKPTELFLCLFLSLWPFQLYFTLWILPTTLRFLTLFFFWSYSALLVFSTIYYLFLKVFLSPNVILCGGLGPKH